jgi:hypothetical protein
MKMYHMGNASGKNRKLDISQHHHRLSQLQELQEIITGEMYWEKAAKEPILLWLEYLSAIVNV